MVLKYVSLSLLICMLLGCGEKKLEKERFSYSMPVIHLDSSIEFFKSDFAIISYGDITMYELPYWESFSKNDSLISETSAYEYFVFRNNDKDGYLVKRLEDTIKQKANKDSLLSLRAYYHNNFDSTLSLKNSHTIEAGTNGRFTIKYLKPNPFVDSIAAYFDVSKKNLKYRLAPKLDSIFESKLYKVVFWQSAKALLNKDKIDTPLLVSFEVKPEEITNPQPLYKFLDHFIEITQTSKKDL